MPFSVIKLTALLLLLFVEPLPQVQRFNGVRVMVQLGELFLVLQLFGRGTTLHRLLLFLRLEPPEELLPALEPQLRVLSVRLIALMRIHLGILVLLLKRAGFVRGVPLILELPGTRARRKRARRRIHPVCLWGVVCVHIRQSHELEFQVCFCSCCWENSNNFCFFFCFCKIYVEKKIMRSTLYRTNVFV